MPADPTASVVSGFAIQEHVARLHDLYAGPQVLPQIIASGTAAVPALEAFLRGPSQSLYQQRALAADALAAIGGEPAIAALTRALRDCAARTPEPLSQQAEDVVVSRITEHLSAHPTAAVLEALLEASSRRPLPAHAAALGRLGDARAVTALIDCLYEDPARPAAAAALRRFGAAAIPELRVALANPRRVGELEPPIYVAARTAAAMLLGEWGDTDSLIAALADGERAVQVAAALSLADHDDDAVRRRAFAVLLVALDDPGWAAAEAVLQALAGYRESIAAAVLALLSRAGMDEAGRRRRRRRAAMLAGRLGLGAAVGPLALLAQESDTPLRFAAVDALARIPAAAEQHLALFLMDTEPAVARRALAALIAPALDAGRSIGAHQISNWLRLTGECRWLRWRRTLRLWLTAVRQRRAAREPRAMAQQERIWPHAPTAALMRRSTTSPSTPTPRNRS